MKERYFDDQSIDFCAGSMIEELKQLRLLRDVNLSPERTALIIIDMQDYFLDESSHAFIPSAAAIRGRLARTADLFEEKGLPVVLTRHINRPGEEGMMGNWWGELLTAENTLSGICEDLKGKGKVIEKSGYDAFYNTELESFLRESGVVRVVVTGVMTHICCAATATSAFVRGFEVIIPVDGTATYNRLFHEAAILNMAHSCASAVTLEKLAVMMRDGK